MDRVFRHSLFLLSGHVRPVHGCDCAVLQLLAGLHHPFLPLLLLLSLDMHSGFRLLLLPKLKLTSSLKHIAGMASTILNASSFRGRPVGFGDGFALQHSDFVGLQVPR